MPAAADPDLAIRLAKTVSDIYGEAATRLLELVARRLARGISEPGWAESKLSEMVGLRNDAQLVLDTLVTLGPDAITAAVVEAYEVGQKAEIVGNLAKPRTHNRAVDALARETVSQVASTHGQILRSVDDAYRAVVAEVSAPGVVTGTETRRQATQRALDRWAGHGITGFRDKAGRNWEIESYAEQATRTSVGRAQVNGTLDRLVDSGHDLVIVPNHPQECKICREWEGKVLSITGRTPGYKTMADATADGLLHANCRHRPAAFIPGLTEVPTVTADPEGDALRQEQRRLERGVREWKRRQAVALDDDAKAAAGAKVRAWQARLKEHVDTNDLKRLRYREQIGRAR